MVVRETPGFWRLFFVMQGSILPKTLPKVVAILVLAIVATVLHRYYPELFSVSSVTAFTLLGISLSLFLGFRNHASYERWWEGRKIWGSLMFSSRNLHRQMNTFFCAEDELSRACRTRIARLNIAFIYAVNRRLRPNHNEFEAARFLTAEDSALLETRSNNAVAILQIMGRELGKWHRQGLIDSVSLRDINRCLNQLSEDYCACERILTTPIPFAYMLLLHRTAYAYCVLLPWGLVASIGMATPIVAALVAYTFFGFDALSEELASPFSRDTNSLPIDAMTRQLEIETLQAVDSPLDAPAPLTGRGYIVN
ncbi:bestrophin family protein [Carnimonas bestiolae]|uniref:bestrophin family protein n=1 Tax=Carnimonas bestiolae TaxID=3402172 RepID=UPI003EDBB1FA